MSGKVTARLRELGTELPPAPPVGGSYVPCRREGSLVFVSGQVSVDAQQGPLVGKLGANCSIDEGRAAARCCALNLLAQLHAHCGGIDRIEGCLQLTGYVNATPDFEHHAQVMNGASELINDVFGEAGRHTRASVGMGSLPLGVAVEVAGVFRAADG